MEAGAGTQNLPGWERTVLRRFRVGAARGRSLTLPVSSMAAIWPPLFKRQNLSILPFTPPQKPPVTSLATVAVWGVFSSGSNIAAAITSQTFAPLSRFRRAARYSGLNRPWRGGWGRGGHHQPTPPPLTCHQGANISQPSEGIFPRGRGRLFPRGRGLLVRRAAVPTEPPLCGAPGLSTEAACASLHHTCATLASGCTFVEQWRFHRSCGGGGGEGGIATVTDVGLVSG